MKLFIGITGLFLIHQPAPTAPIEVLFLEARGKTVQVGKQRIELPAHELRIRTGLPGSTQEEWSFPRGFELRIGNDTTGVATELVRDGFLQLGEVYDDACRPSVAARCTGPDALTTCGSDWSPFLQARLVLRGGTLRAAEVLDEAVKLQRSEVQGCTHAEQQWWEMKPVLASSTGESGTLRRQTFNGALFELELPAVGPHPSVEVYLGETRLRLPVSKGDFCQTLDPAADRCAYLRLTNAVADGHGTGLGQRSEQLRFAGVDLHFLLNYSILELPAGCPKLVPHWSPGNSGCEPGGGNRCIPPVCC